jgi:UDP-glucose 4-epimerase
MTRQVLVTGGAGFIGSNLVKRLVKEGYRVVSLDDYSTGNKDNHIEGVKYITGDIELIE